VIKMKVVNMKVLIVEDEYSLADAIRESLEKDTDRDYFMDAKEAKEYGIIDKILSRKEKID